MCHRSFLVVAFALAGVQGLQAQQILNPVWSRTWTFGQGDPMAFNPASADNHVAVDPLTGHVYTTIDDELEQFGPRFDLLYSFTSTGDELTPTSPPQLGSVAPGPGDLQNVEHTSDLAAHSGIVYHARELNLGLMDGTTGSLHATAQGAGWKFGMGKEALFTASGKVLVDDGTVFAVRSLTSESASLHALTADGWPLWSRSYPGLAMFTDAVIIGNEILAGSGTTIARIDRSTGDLIDTWSLPTSDYLRALATDGTRLYWLAQSMFTSWGCMTVEGGAIWSLGLDMGITASELVVDGFGRPWFIGNAISEGEPPLLVVTGSEGSIQAVAMFTYGASMNDMAVGAGQVYITGRSVAGDIGTYLIAVSTDITTSVPSSTAPILGLYPNPANATLTVIGTEPILGHRVLSATGQLLDAPLQNGVLDVNDLVDGVYLLEVITAQGTVTRRFEVRH